MARSERENGRAPSVPTAQEERPPANEHTTELATEAATEPGQALAVTVVVPTRNRGALIAETLEALLRLRYPRMEILVVDQSTDERTQDAVRAAAGADERVRYHQTATVGSSAGRNIGALLSAAEVVAYTDDDCIVTEDWLDAIVAELRDPTVAAVYGRLLPYERDNATGHDVGRKDEVARQEFAGRMPPWYIGHGGNMAFRRADLLAAGGFDLLLAAGGLLCSSEDGDISYRLLVAGKRVVYSPAAMAYHKHWKDWNAQKRMERAYGIGVGAQFAKYVRCGDRYGARLLGIWLWQLGVRRVGAGLLKWRSTKPMYLGYCQLVYPWIGIARSLRYQVEPRRMIYLHPDAGANAEAVVPLEVPSAVSVMDGAIVAPSAIAQTNAVALARSTRREATA